MQFHDRKCYYQIFFIVLVFDFQKSITVSEIVLCDTASRPVCVTLCLAVTVEYQLTDTRQQHILHAIHAISLLK